MNIQIRNNADSDARAEITGRVKGLMRSMGEAVAKGLERKDDAPQAVERLREEVQSLFIALLGFAPTRDEVYEMIGV